MCKNNRKYKLIKPFNNNSKKKNKLWLVKKLKAEHLKADQSIYLF